MPSALRGGVLVRRAGARRWNDRYRCRCTGDGTFPVQGPVRSVPVVARLEFSQDHRQRTVE